MQICVQRYQHWWKTNSQLIDEPQSYSKTCSPRLADRDGETQHSSKTKLTRTRTPVDRDRDRV